MNFLRVDMFALEVTEHLGCVERSQIKKQVKQTRRKC